MAMAWRARAGHAALLLLAIASGGTATWSDRERSIFENVSALRDPPVAPPAPTPPELWQRLEGCWGGRNLAGYTADPETAEVCCQDGGGGSGDVLLAIMRDAWPGLGALVLGTDGTMSRPASDAGAIPDPAVARRVLPVRALTQEEGGAFGVDTMSVVGSLSLDGCWELSLGPDGASLEAAALHVLGRLEPGGFAVEPCLPKGRALPVTTCAWPSCWQEPAPEKSAAGADPSLSVTLGHKTTRSRLVLTRADAGRCALSAPAAQEVSAIAPALDAWVIPTAAAASGVAVVLAVWCVVWRRRRAEKKAARSASVETSTQGGSAQDLPAQGCTLESSALFGSGSLVDVISQGIKEHWVVAPQDLELMRGPRLAGGFGDVKRARLMNSSDVAIKVCRNFDGAEKKHASAALALKNEVRVFRRVRHANIVLFYGVTVLQGGALGIVLEWVAGGHFGQFVKHRRDSGDYIADCLSRVAALPEFKLLQDIARALSFLHGQTPPILHRDLKPQNVLVEDSRPPKAKLTDFGLSVFVAEGREVSARAGTSSYMAPEVDTRVVYTISADIFSLGCVVLFAAMACTPKGGSQLQAAEALHASADPVWGASGVAGLAVDSLQADPEARPSASEALARLSAAASPGP